MKAVFNREGLLTAFQIAASVVPARSTKTILEHVKLELDAGGDAILSATDLEIGVRYRVSGVDIQEPGEVILPTAQVHSILRELPDDEIVLEETPGGVRLVGRSSKFELASEDPLQYPEIPQFGDGPVQRIKSGDLALMIRRTVFAVASEDSRYAFNSVLLELDEKKGTALFVASDGKRLAMMPGPCTVTPDRPEGLTLIRPKVLSLLAKVILDPEEEVEISVRSNEILFRTHKMTLYGRLAEGRFPKYQDVFPGKTTIRIPVVVGSFLGAIRQARIVTNLETKGVSFRFASGEATLTTRTADLGESEIHLPIGYDGETIEVTYDPALLQDALRVLDAGEEVYLEMVDAKRATVLRTGDAYEYLVMPLNVEKETRVRQEAEAV